MEQQPHNSPPPSSAASVAASERLPLDVVLDAFAADAGDPRMTRAVERLKSELASGKSLEEGLSATESTTPRHIAGVLRSATSAEQLADVCDRFAELRETNDAAWQNLRSLMIYPTLLMVTLVGVSLVAAYYVLPQFDDLYRDFDLELPVATEGVLDVWPQAPWLLLGLTLFWLAATGLPSLLGVGFTLRNALPVAGRLFTAMGQEQFASALASFVELQMPLPTALDYTADVLNDRHLARATRHVARLTEQGVALSEAMAASSAFDRALAVMVRWGEQRSDLAGSLQMASDMFAEGRRQRMLLLRRVLPPVVLVAVASGVLATVVALLIPLIKLIEGLS